MKMNKKLLALFLLIFPLVLLIIGFSFDRTRYGTDPESAYLFNGLNIAMLQSVGLYDHPGTTVHAFNAVVISGVHLVRNTGTSLETDVLTHSEFYIEVLRKSYMILNVLLLFFLGLTALALLKNIWLALTLQVVPFLSVTLVEEISTKIAPEQLLFTSTLLLIMLILKYYTSANQKSRWFAVVFGFLCAFGLASKFTFLPMLVIPFIILKETWNKFIYLITIIPSFILFTLPAAPAYKLMIKWFLALGSHTGTYGQGEKGFINLPIYLKSFIDLSVFNKALSVAILSSFLLLLPVLLRSLLKKNSHKKEETRYIAALFTALAGSVVMVAKHYHNNHYLFPALSMITLVYVFIYLWFFPFDKKEVAIKRNRFIAPAILVVFILLTLFNIPYLSLAYEGYRLSNKSTDETMARIENEYKGYVKTYYYPGSFNEMSQLRWGNVYARRYHTDALMKLYPEGLFYNVLEKNFQLWETTIIPAEFLKKYGGRILLIGGPQTAEELKQVEASGLKLKKLFDGRIQIVYEVDTAQSDLFHHVKSNSTPLRVINNDLETLSPDKQWIVVNGENFCKNTALSGEKPRSGKFSFSLPGMDTYAMEYKLNGVLPGQLYEISVWRSGGTEETTLVVSAEKPDDFYIRSKGVVETDAGGWEKVSLIFRIPLGFSEKSLKVYLWNHSNTPAWFDDVEITLHK